MKNVIVKNAFWIVLVSFVFSTGTYAQGVIDGFMTGAGKTELALSYSHEKFSSFWKGNRLIYRDWRYITRSTSLYGSHGITEDLDIVVNLPYISASVAGKKATGLQDLGVYLNYRAYDMPLYRANLQVIGSFGIQQPMSRYENTEMPYIGHRSTNVDMRAVGQYKMDNGLFAMAQMGYTLKVGPTPNTTSMVARVGYAANDYYVDAWIDKQKGYNGTSFNETEFYKTAMSYVGAGVTAYTRIYKGLGATLSIGSTIKGKNVGRAARLSTSVVYKFDRPEKKKTPIDMPNEI